MAKRFRIAFSFAGETREFVSDVANILAGKLGRQRVLYDKYHEAELARPNLAAYLPPLYLEEADLVVAVICKDYETKPWCGLEWDAICALLKKRQERSVMLTRFGRVEAPGLHGLEGYLDLDDKTPAQAAAAILRRLELLDRGTEERATPGWPESEPVLDWPVANHRAAQSAFAGLIVRSSPYRLLAIHGPSETGKSHLTKQFMRNAFKVKLYGGRLDFKGSTNLSSALREFAENLDVAVPPRKQSCCEQLSNILSSLRARAEPTLLIFDTFESAGEAERWLRKVLLPKLAQATSSWLRVVVVGQTTTLPHGEPWAACSAEPIRLVAPSAEEWFAFGREHRPDIPLKFIRELHEYSAGKCGLLAQLLAPKS